MRLKAGGDFDILKKQTELQGKICKGDRMRKKYRKAYITAVVLLILAVVYTVANAVSIWIFSNEDQKIKSDVAIILGASTYNGEVSPVYKERINHGIDLYNEGYVDKLIVTGGMGAGNDISDAESVKNYAVICGIPENDILVENESSITQENLENSKAIMDENDLKTAIIVSDPLHMRRAMLLAKDAGITAYSSPTETTKYVSLKTKIPFLAREVFFYTGYKWWRIFFRFSMK